MPLFAVMSEYQVPPEQGKEVFTRHLGYMDQLQSQRRVFVAGPFGDGKGALIVLNAASLKEAEEIASNDPIHKEGIRKFHIREWKPVRFMSWGLTDEK